MKKLALERSTRPLYDMPAPNAGLSRRGKLPDLYRNETQWAFRAENTADTWLDPALLEDALDCDEKLHGLLVEVLDAERRRVSKVRMRRRVAIDLPEGGE